MSKISKHILILTGIFFCHSAQLFAQTAVLNSELTRSQKQINTPEEQVNSLKLADGSSKTAQALFSDKDIQGSGGSVFLGYSGQLADIVSGISGGQIKNNLTFGGKFFFLFKNFLRLGVEGSVLKPLSTGNPSGYTLGALVEMISRFDPVLLEYGLSIGYGDYDSKPYFVAFPKIGCGLRITNEFSATLFAGYMLFLNSASFVDAKEIIAQSQPFLGLFLTFGVF